METQFKLDLLKKAMEIAKLRPIDLSRKSGVSKGTLSKILAGTCNPGIRTLQKISAVLDIPWHWFVINPDLPEREGSQPTPGKVGE
jgi:transcriptional regulator with XRE-family HTH domain